MQCVQQLLFYQLVLPGTHDSHTYHLQNFVLNLNPLFSAQSMTITEQLMNGIWVLDIRTCWYSPNARTKRAYYTSHTLLCLPLTTILDQVKSFLSSHPSEIVTLLFKADYLICNLSQATSNEVVFPIDSIDTYYRDDFIQYVMDYMGGKEVFIDSYDDTTKVKDLTS